MKVKVQISTAARSRAPRRPRAQRRRLRHRAAAGHPARSSPGSCGTGARPRVRPASARVSRTGKKFGSQKGGGTAATATARPRSSSAAARPRRPSARFHTSLNKKIRALGLKMALSSKARTSSRRQPRGQGFQDQGAQGQFDKNGWSGKVLVIDRRRGRTSFARAVGNLPGINVMPAWAPTSTTS